MFTKKKQEAPSKLDEAIDRLHSEMENINGDSEEYAALVDQLAKLHKIKNENKPDRVSKDALVSMAGNLAGIALIINHERLHVITTKALGFVTKSR